ncbi:MAG: hypothetical protein JAY99_01785 [Candidatus Thiodiazotropha lotti]|nr:hypothetical protein [Candidatus Thiodiazotropha lotti]MCG7998233.1 hypothetical protein [Candidatus Thiodiazotropha lotti]MCW4182862.1 hypothetical protein [Candidatus Thiodiazotropha weberae]MCW4189999.1 hypothetical protein [Candidatus Thiodiazotropha weberae]
MKKILKPNKRLLLSQLLWKKRLNKQQLPHAGYMGNGGDIHLVLGVDGTGISHFVQLLSQSLPENHYIHHPLVKFEPKLTLSNHGERLAMPYQKVLTADHPMSRVYRIYVEREQAEKRYDLMAEDREAPPDPILILKESHGLLATEALLRELKCHCLLYLSDPVLLAEQMFSKEGIETAYLDFESEAVMDPAFLKRFLAKDLRPALHAYKLIQRLSSRRQRRVQMKIFTIALIQHMFRMLAARYPELATLVDAAVIEDDPKRLEFPLVNWLGPENLHCATRVIGNSTFTQEGQQALRWTRSWPESITSFEALSNKDVKLAYKLLIDHQLMSDESKRKTWAGKSVA